MTLTIGRSRDIRCRADPLLLPSEIVPNIWDSEQLWQVYWWDHGRCAWWMSIRDAHQLPPAMSCFPGSTERRWIRYSNVHDAGNARREGFRLGSRNAAAYPPGVPFLLLQLVDPHSPLLRWVAHCTYVCDARSSVAPAVPPLAAGEASEQPSSPLMVSEELPSVTAGQLTESPSSPRAGTEAFETDARHSSNLTMVASPDEVAPVAEGQPPALSSSAPAARDSLHTAARHSSHLPGVLSPSSR